MTTHEWDDQTAQRQIPPVLSRMLELWNGSGDNPADVYAAKCLLNGGPTTFEPREVEADIRTLRGAFPDVRFLVDDAFAADSRHVLKMRARGTHSGAAFDSDIGKAQPSGRAFEMHGIEVFEIRDDRIVDVWIGWNFGELYAALGARLDDGAPAAEDGN